MANDLRLIDPRERFGDETELLDTVVDGVLARLPKAGPVSLSQDSKDGHTVQLQPSTKSLQRLPDGTVMEVKLPVIPDVPIHFMGGAGIATTHGLKSGNEGFTVPAALGIDPWHQQGGVQSPGDTRQYALWDAVFIPGLRNDTNKLKGVSPDSTQTRTDDKQSLHDVSQTAVTAIRKTSTVQVNDMAVQSQKDGASHVVDGKTIQHIASKILLNC